jgi:hypothetical protein
MAYREGVKSDMAGVLRPIASGREVTGLISVVARKSSAARAALRGTSPLPHLLQRAEPVRPWWPTLVGCLDF